MERAQFGAVDSVLALKAAVLKDPHGLREGSSKVVQLHAHLAMTASFSFGYTDREVGTYCWRGLR